MLYTVYVAHDATYTEDFWRRYKMSNEFFHVHSSMCWREQQVLHVKHDYCVTTGYSSIHECTTAMRMLVYGSPADSHDDYFRMSESSTIECLHVLQSGCGKVQERVFERAK
jgi:hypothetical protein